LPKRPFDVWIESEFGAEFTPELRQQEERLRAQLSNNGVARTQ
jgi:hypothetical protein